MPREPWFAVLRPLPGRRRLWLWLLSFVLPVLLWSAVSYVPFLWHPVMRVTAPGDVAWFTAGMMIDRHEFAREAEKVVAVGGRAPEGYRANPIFLPAPHQVARALYTAFTTKPVLRGDVWLHESLWLSIQTIFWGFVVSSAIGVPLGILCGSYSALARLTEPLVDFIRYMPAPAFGARMARPVAGQVDAILAALWVHQVRHMGVGDASIDGRHIALLAHPRAGRICDQEPVLHPSLPVR